MQKFPILYEDDQLLVINKSYGVVVNRAQTVKEPTIQDWMDEKFEIQKREVGVHEQSFKERSGIVHRLDKETSGCLILAKEPTSFFKIQASFKERLVHKMYIALVHGKLVPESGEINAPVGRLPWNREQFGVVPGGKDAFTKYKVVNYYSSSPSSVILGLTEDPDSRFRGNDNKASSHIRSNKNELFAFVHLFPETGRTHQLRVHMKYLGFPIVGDYLYAGRKTQRDDRVWCPRVFLHAAKLEFPHPVTGKMISIEAPLPEELEKVLAVLEQIH